MKVNSVEPDFKPFVLQITIESQIERDMLREMLSYDASIPDLFEEDHSLEDMQLLQSMMKTIRSAL